MAGESQAVVMTAPTIVFPQKATVVLQEGHPLDLARYPPSNTTLIAQAHFDGSMVKKKNGEF